MQARQGRTPRAVGRLGLPHALMMIAGLATFVLVASVLQDRSETEQVWVVDADVAAGAAIEASDLVAVEVASDAPLLAPLLRAADGVPVGRVRNGVVAGEPLLASDLVPVDELSVGRTFTIPIDTMVVEGLGLIRGDRVDVIGSYVGGDMGYVVVDVEVVRLPGASSSGAFAAASSRTTWVTVSIDDVQALALSAAIDRGEVQLVRSTGAVAIRIDEPVSDVGNEEATATSEAGS